jgi:hypothetical protein
MSSSRPAGMGRMLQISRCFIPRSRTCTIRKGHAPATAELSPLLRRPGATAQWTAVLNLVWPDATDPYVVLRIYGIRDPATRVDHAWCGPLLWCGVPVAYPARRDVGDPLLVSSVRRRAPPHPLGSGRMVVSESGFTVGTAEGAFTPRAGPDAASLNSRGSFRNASSFLYKGRGVITARASSFVCRIPTGPGNGGAEWQTTLV